MDKTFLTGALVLIALGTFAYLVTNASSGTAVSTSGSSF